MSTSQLYCPACQTPYAPHETICAVCGLVFATHTPDAQPLPVAAPQAVSSLMPLQSGQTLAGGRYTIQRSLSRGGMGAIYLAADHQAFDRAVVIKAMLDYCDPANAQEIAVARERFVQEARTLAALHHPAIPQIYAYFQDGPHNYIVMEYIEGLDLEQGLTHRDKLSGAELIGQPYSLADVLRWSIALCRVLEYLGSRRPSVVVHHDIKPANLLLDRNSDEIRLVDFGTARARLLAQPGAAGARQSTIYGTSGYAAPEQYRGHSESRSDVYALAATLYHLATDDDPRTHPFSFPRLHALGPLGAMLGAALNNDVARRPTAADLRHKLEALLTPAGARPLQAPDGTELADAQALVHWCEQHWPEAAEWLYDRLPEQIQVLWGQTKLAKDLRAGNKANAGDRAAGLDAALALLDPADFGVAKPRLGANTSNLDFSGVGGRQNANERLVTIINIGRRYVHADIEMPVWIKAEPKQLALVPGQHQTCRLSAVDWQLAPFSKVRESIEVRYYGQALLTIRAQGEASFSASVVRSHPWLIIGLLVGAYLLCLVMLWLGNTLR